MAEVAAFKAAHGHWDVPLNYPENPKLGRFVSVMRSQRNTGRLSPDRVAKLNALGFAWQSRRTEEVARTGINAAWKARFDELLRYKAKKGDCNVPAGWPENPPLGRWVNQQRFLRKAGTLRPQRQQCLDEINFAWHSDRRREDWATRFAQLKAYRKHFGHCRVPRTWKANPKLGTWVCSQRRLRKIGTLSPDKERLLSDIGFDWRQG